MLTSELHETPNVEKKNNNKQFRREEQRPPRLRRKNRMNKPNTAQNQMQKNNDEISVKDLTSEHLEALKASFEKILQERFLSKIDHNQHMSIYHHLRDLILKKRSDAQIILYGSLLFECCLNDANIIDIDIQFNETFPYETLNEVFEIIRHSTYYKNARINTEHEPLSLDLSIVNSNILVRFTSHNIRAIQLSKIIQIYTKFDERVIPLFRLFRIFSKICNIDRSDLGTLHPIVFHLMIIYFLQQLDPPILPCLHEYVFGIDKIPIVVSNEQYADFFRICNVYAGQWKSKNTTSFELLFLQLLSYYVQKFDLTRFVISIQTRMPLLKNERQMFNRKLFCIDPTSLSRNLCYTMKANRSFNYFQCILKKALNYFCQTEMNENQNKNNSISPLINTVDKSYTLFIEHFPKNNGYWRNLQLDNLGQYYKQIFDQIKIPLPIPILKINDNKPTIISQNELQSIDKKETFNNEYDHENIGNTPILFEKLCKDLNENQKTTLRKEYDKEVTIFNNKLQQILDDIKSSSNSLSADETLPDKSCSSSISKDKQAITSSINSPKFFYDIQAKYFDADEGAPAVCIICYKSDHIKSNCPELSIPNIIDLPIINKEWIKIISRICRQITDQCKPMKEDIKIREDILKYLQNEFEKCYPLCDVKAYGSSHNGFGLRYSDLDICVILKDNNKESNIIVLEKLSQILELNSYIFKNIEFIRDARVPIIRSIHSHYNIEIDISLHNALAMENTRLLKIYTEIDPRVSQLGYMIKHLVKKCDIGDASNGTLSSYAYIIMLIHFLQQIQPAVLPVLQQLNDDPLKKNNMIRECNTWNIYFYDNLSKLKEIWINKNGPNTMTIGELWIKFLRYYTEQFDYEKNIVTIRQIESLQRYEKGWFKQTIAIEDPFILTHNLADKLSLQKWTLIRRVFIRARQQFCLQSNDININQFKLGQIREYLFDINILCPEYAEKFHKFNQKPGINNKQKQKLKPTAIITENNQNVEQLQPLMKVRPRRRRQRKPPMANNTTEKVCMNRTEQLLI